MNPTLRQIGIIAENSALRRIFALSFLFILLSLAAWSYNHDGIIALLLQRNVQVETRLQSVQDYFMSYGALAPIAYIFVVTIEVVVAPIPGLMLYAPGGIIFGGFWGGLFALVGNVLGAGIACQVMRSLGGSFMSSHLQKKSLKKTIGRLSDNGVWVVFLLRVNPLTSSDLVSYAAGLTAMPTWKVMLGTLFGMVPLCWLQAYFADGLLEHFPDLLYPLIAACVLYSLVVILVIWKLISTSPQPPIESDHPSTEDNVQDES